jgi:hypothetical protein
MVAAVAYVPDALVAPRIADIPPGDGRRGVRWVPYSGRCPANRLGALGQVDRAVDVALRGRFQPEARHDVRTEVHIAMLPYARSLFPMRTPEEWALCADQDWAEGGDGYLDRIRALASGVARNKIADALDERRRGDALHVDGHLSDEELARRHPNRIPLSVPAQRELRRLGSQIEREYPGWWRVPVGDAGAWQMAIDCQDIVDEAIDRRRAVPVTATETSAQLWERVDHLCAFELRARFRWSGRFLDDRIRPMLRKFFTWEFSREPGTRARSVTSNFVLWCVGQSWPDERDRWDAAKRIFWPGRGGLHRFSLLEMTWLAGLAGLRPEIELTTATAPLDVLRETYDGLRKPALRYSPTAIEADGKDGPSLIPLMHREEKALPWTHVSPNEVADR